MKCIFSKRLCPQNHNDLVVNSGPLFIIIYLMGDWNLGNWLSVHAKQSPSREKAISCAHTGDEGIARVQRSEPAPIRQLVLHMIQLREPFNVSGQYA